MAIKRDAIKQTLAAEAPADTGTDQQAADVVDIRPAPRRRAVDDTPPPPAKPRGKAPATRRTPRAEAGTAKQQPQEDAEPKGPATRPRSMLFTTDQLNWLEEQGRTRRVKLRHLILQAVSQHHKELEAHFQRYVEEGDGLFQWRGDPEDVEGSKLSKSVRMSDAEFEKLVELAAEAGAPTHAFYVRIAVDKAMKRG